jgi:hypothetical protein
VVDEGKETPREPEQDLVHRGLHGTLLEAPVAAAELGEAVQDCAQRPEAERGQGDEPEEDAEHVPVRCQQRVLHHMPQHFRARQLARVEVAPLGEQPPRLVLVAAFERVADVGEVVAELPEAERAVEHDDVEGQAEQRVLPVQQQIDTAHGERRYEHGRAPSHPGMVRATGVEVATAPGDVGAQRLVRGRLARQRLDLLQHQRHEDREKTHRRR